MRLQEGRYSNILVVAILSECLRNRNYAVLMLREMVKFTTCVIVILHVARVFGVDLAAI